MTLKQTYNSLCPPAKLYLVIQSFAILLLFIQNLRDTNNYRVGSYKIPLGHHNIYYFFVKIFVLVTWTWILNKLCTKQYEGVAWFLVLIPFILFFVGIGLVVISGLHKSKQFGSGTMNYQPIYMRQVPSNAVLGDGHTASCQCPKCEPPIVYPIAPFVGPGGTKRPPFVGPGGTKRPPFVGPGGTQTVTPMIYGRQGPITQNYPVQFQSPSNVPQQYIVQ